MHFSAPSHSPFEFASHPYPPGVTDNEVLWHRYKEVINDIFGVAFNTPRMSVGLPKVDSARDHVSADQT
jgi:vancomycin aglycone glucosyltransferase